MPRILVVEDRYTSRAFVRGLFRPRGWEMLEAEDGAQGLAMAIREKPDVIVSDIEMPNLDGLAMCRFIRSHRTLADTPVVLVTSKTDAKTRAEGERVKASAFLAKPIDADELEAVIEKLLASKT